MSVFLMALSLLVISGDGQNLLRSAEPGSEAAAAYELLGTDEEEAACAAFLEQLRNRSVDPWAFRGAAQCAGNVPETRSNVLATLDSLPQHSALVLFARGYLSYQVEELKEAEKWLRFAVEQAPDLALAWNTLGTVVRELGDAQGALPLVEKALSLAPNLEVAKSNLENTRLYAGVFERLLNLLERLPKRWAELPDARVPISGRSIEEVLVASSEEDRQLALAFISALALSSPEDREELISAWLQEHAPREVDLWLPLYVAQHEAGESLDEAALTYEAALQWAASMGRRDVLFFVAGAVANILGENEDALAAYRRAREIHQTVGSQVGLGNSWRGEADFPAMRQTTFGSTAAEFQFYEEQAAKADHLLIATHGIHTQASRRGTYLQIKPTPDVHDERLTAAEIAAIPLNAELVTLAACDTDRGDASLSDERLTLTRSFLIAGAASVLATR